MRQAIEVEEVRARGDSYDETIARGKHGNGYHKRNRVGEPAMAALRAYRTHHPSIRIYLVHRNGRDIWLTWKQWQVLRYVEDPHHKRKRLTLRDIAKACRCHYSTVQRMLKRFALWGIIHYIPLLGRYGGSWLLTLSKSAKSGWAMRRKVERSWLATQIRLYEWRKRREEKERKASRTQWVQSGSMDATLQ